MSEAVMPAMVVLRPEVHPPSSLPRWTWAAIALGGVAGLIMQWAGNEALPWLTYPLGLLGVVGLGTLGQWLEAHWFARLSRESLASRLVLGLFTPVFTMVALGVVLLVLSGSLKLNGRGDATASATWFIQPLLFLALWVGSASIGSTVVLIINHVISRFVRGFRARVTFAILSLLGFSTGVSVLVLVAAMSFLGSIAGAEVGNLNLTVNGAPISGEVFRQWVIGHPALVGLAFFGLSVIVTLPAVISASLHLAEAVMERLRPLSAALKAVGEGQRALQVEEAGSRDFIEVNQRFNTMVAALARGERMERAFGVYVSGHVLERIRSQHGEAAIPASLRDATVFFADIRGFTSISERLPPEAVVGFLNRYFARVVQVVDRHQGYLNKFIGDAVVVVFNGPMDQPDHAARALACALELQDEVRAMNAAHAFPEVGELRIGIGVATGPMVCGNIGSATQMEYTVIGDTVNLSARLTSHAGPGEVWANEQAVAQLPQGLVATALPPLKVKGKDVLVTPARVERRPVT